MLNWVCPKCSREVAPGLTRCPFCGFEEAKPQAAASVPDVTALGAPAGATPKTVVRRVIVRRKTDWGPWLADVERGFRFGLGFVAALAVTYFVLYLIAYYGGYGEWADKLAQWLRMR